MNKALDVATDDEPDRHLSILELQGDPLQYVLEFLDTKSLCNAMQVEVNPALGQMFRSLSLMHFGDIACVSQVCKGWRIAGLQTRSYSLLHNPTRFVESIAL